MGLAQNIYLNVPNGELRLYEDMALLQSLGVLGRRRRYSKIIHVNSDTAIGKDANKVDNVGAPWDRPLNSMDAANSYVEDGRGDIIILQDSGVAAAEEDIAITKDSLTIVGMGDPWSAAGIVPDSAVTTAIITASADADNLMLKNLRLDSTTGLGDVFRAAAGADGLWIDGCLIIAKGETDGSANIAINLSVGTVVAPKITNCTFWADTLLKALIDLKAGPTGALIQNCALINKLTTAAAGGVVDAILVQTGTGVWIDNVTIQGGDLTDDSVFANGIDIDGAAINTVITRSYIGNCTANVTNGGIDTMGADAGEGWIDCDQT